MVTFTVTGTASEVEQITLSQGVINNFNTLLLYKRQVTNNATAQDITNGDINWDAMVTAEKIDFVHDCIVLFIRGFEWICKTFFGLSES